jgi:hypothetical protein
MKTLKQRGTFSEEILTVHRLGVPRKITANYWLFAMYFMELGFPDGH